MSVDFTLVSDAAQAVGGWQPYGLPVKALLELYLAALFVLSVSFRGYKWANASWRWVAGTPSPKNVKVVESEAEQKDQDDSPEETAEPWSAAMEVAYRALSRGRAAYDPQSHELHCPGLMVKFVNNDSSVITEIIGDPQKGEKAGWSGHDLVQLLSPEELTTLKKEAFEARKLVVERDRAEANVDAAAHMCRAAYKGFPRLHEDDELDSYELLLDDRLPQDKKQLRGGTNKPKQYLNPANKHPNKGA